MLKMKLDKTVMNNIAKILIDGEKELVDVYYNYLGTSVYFSTKSYPNMLCLRMDEENYIITQIHLKNKRIGTFSKVIKELKKLTSYDCRNIVVENVITNEMYNFCVKNKFKKIYNEVYEFMPESYIGSYILA